MASESFTSKIVGVVVATIVVAAIAIPIVSGLVGTDGTPSGATYPIQEGTTLATIVTIIPVFLVLAVMMIVVRMFMNGKN